MPYGEDVKNGGFPRVWRLTAGAGEARFAKLRLATGL